MCFAATTAVFLQSDGPRTSKARVLLFFWPESAIVAWFGSVVAIEDSSRLTGVKYLVSLLFLWFLLLELGILSP